MVERLNGMPAPADCQMNQPVWCDSERYVRDVTVFAIREKQEVTRENCFQAALHVHSLSCLLPGVPQQPHPVQGKNSLNHS